MEKFNEKKLTGPKPIQSSIFKSPIKINPFKIDRTAERYHTFPRIMNRNLNQEIVEAMRKTVFQYQSILLIDNIYVDEPQTPEYERKKETCETQQKLAHIDRKGYHFFQYTANNPIQDSICHFEIPELNAFVVSIFDGHGGPQLSKFCAQNTQHYLQKWIRHSIKLHKYENNKLQLIKDGLRELHFEFQNQFYKKYLKKIAEKQHRKIRSVGTCAITAVLWQKKCIIANCGDSQAMVISQDRGSYNYQKLSERFSVGNKAERLRLAKQFKEIDQNIVVQERKNVYYLKGMLQPTKSIGDFYLKHKQHYLGQDEFKGPYLSCEPDIRVYDIKQHDKHLVIASDGLWDYLSKWEILKYVIESRQDKSSIAERETQPQTQDQIQPKPLMSAKFLTEKILQKVSNDFDFDINYIKSLQLGERRSYHDDMTIAIIDIDEFFGKTFPNL